jgi:exoribonuclease-2
MVDELKAGRLPAEFGPILPQLIYKPDRNRGETKALEAACGETGKSAARLLFDCGALASTHDYHLGRFLFEFFPEGKGGTGFPAFAAPVEPADLPLAEVPRSVSTTRIPPKSTMPSRSRQARGRLAHRHPHRRAGPRLRPGLRPRPHRPRTAVHGVYAGTQDHHAAGGRGRAFHAGRRTRPCRPSRSISMSLADYRLLGHETRIERVPVVANLRHHDIEPVFNADDPGRGPGRLSPIATSSSCSGNSPRCSKPGAASPRTTATARTTTSSSTGPPTAASRRNRARASSASSERERGSPLDTLVAELMIVANATWGAMLRDAGIPALYRVQTAGKVRMSTVAAAHEGLGVDCYAWSSSPLRRYCDLLNQWQLIALLRRAAALPAQVGRPAGRDARLRADLRRLRRIPARHGALLVPALAAAAGRRNRPSAHVLREALVRLETIPLVARVPSLPDTPRGAAVRLSIEGIDLLEAEMRLRYLELAPELAANTGL